MQTFSGMRRNSSYSSRIEFVFAVLFFVLLQTLSNSFVFLPTFAGVFFYYIIINIDNEDKFFYIVVSFLYLAFYELNKGFYLFSSIMLFIIFYYFFIDKIRSSFSCKSCIVGIYILFFYIGHYFLNYLISYILNRKFTPFSFEYFYYIAFDFIVAIILYRYRV